MQPPIAPREQLQDVVIHSVDERAQDGEGARVAAPGMLRRGHNDILWMEFRKY